MPVNSKNEFVAWVRPARMSANTHDVRIAIDEYGEWSATIPAFIGNLSNLQTDSIVQIEQKLAALSDGRWWASSVTDVELAGRRFGGVWECFWANNVNPRRTEIGVAVMMLLELMLKPTQRLGAWIAAQGLVSDWKNLGVDRGRLDDPRLGIPLTPVAWNVEIVESSFGRGRVQITDGLTVAEFW